MNLELEIGLALAVVGLGLAAFHWLRRQGTSSAKGSVVRIEVLEEATKQKSAMRSVKLTVRFNDAQGLVRFFTTRARSDDRKPGDAVGVLYKLKDPQQATLDDITVWVAPILIVVIGAGLTVLGFLKG